MPEITLHITAYNKRIKRGEGLQKGRVSCHFNDLSQKVVSIDIHPIAKLSGSRSQGTVVAAASIDGHLFN